MGRQAAFLACTRRFLVLPHLTFHHSSTRLTCTTCLHAHCHLALYAPSPLPGFPSLLPVHAYLSISGRHLSLATFAVLVGSELLYTTQLPPHTLHTLPYLCSFPFSPFFPLSALPFLPVCTLLLPAPYFCLPACYYLHLCTSCPSYTLCAACFCCVCGSFITSHAHFSSLVAGFLAANRCAITKRAQRSTRARLPVGLHAAQVGGCNTPPLRRVAAAGCLPLPAACHLSAAVAVHLPYRHHFSRQPLLVLPLGMVAVMSDYATPVSSVWFIVAHRRAGWRKHRVQDASAYVTVCAIVISRRRVVDQHEERRTALLTPAAALSVYLASYRARTTSYLRHGVLRLAVDIVASARHFRTAAHRANRRAR